MKFTEIKSISTYLKNSRLIGVGTTAVCFLMENGNVLKLYLNTYNKRKLFYVNDMTEHLSLLNSISNDSYIGPQEVLIKNGECIGYIYPYVYSKTLSSIDRNKSIYDITKSFDKLIEDTKKVSYKSFRLGDLHDKNILFNYTYSVIDLDKGYIEDRLDIQDIQSANMKNIIKTIIYAIFKVKCFDEISFFDDKISDIYFSTIYYYPEKLGEFLEAIASIYEIKNPTISNFLKNKKYILKSEYNTYYNKYL